MDKGADDVARESEDILMRLGFIILLLITSLWAWRDWSQREITHPAGVLVPAAPAQNNLNPGRAFSFNDFQLIQKASFEIRARVLSTESYRWGTEAELSPIDLALGWGAMSDQSVLDRVEISQGNRWYFFRYQLPAPVSDAVIIQSSGNMHIIPKDKWIEKEVKTLSRGDIVNLKGYLVDVSHASGFHWTTSMTRKDTGNGSCEIFFVEFIQREEKI